MAEIHGQRDDDMARSQKLTDLGLLTQEITKSLAQSLASNVFKVDPTALLPIVSSRLRLVG